MLGWLKQFRNSRIINPGKPSALPGDYNSEVFKIKLVIYSFLHKHEVIGNYVALIAAVWLLITGYWLPALVGLAALFFGHYIVVILLLPLGYFIFQVESAKSSILRNFMLWLFFITYMLLLIALWGYCVIRFIVISGGITVPSVLLGYVIATKLWLSVARGDLMFGNYNMCCFAVFAEIAFISSVISIVRLQRISDPVIWSYLITGLVTIVALFVVWPMGNNYSEPDMATSILNDLNLNGLNSRAKNYDVS